MRMLLTRQIFRSSAVSRRLLRSIGSVSSKNNGGERPLSSSNSEKSRFNEDSMSEHHVNIGKQRPVGWTMYKNKIPVLVEELEGDHHNDHHGSYSSDHTKQQHGLASQHIDDSLLYHETPRTSILMELTDRVGVLHEVLRYFWKYDINVTRIESRPMKPAGDGSDKPKTFDFFLDFDGDGSDPNVRSLLAALQPISNKLLILDSKDAYWFPRHISELDLIADRTLDAGVDLESDHPGFNDKEYRNRRAQLAESAQNHRWDKPIETIDYDEKEIAVWTAVWDKMDGLWEAYACEEFLHSMELMKKHCGYSRTDIPQQEDISEFLQQRSNFRMRPVAGLLSSRDFLNGLAFRVFFCTQYIRHHSHPLYTPEPDICHELLGHAPMFADRDFADFSQEIGLASLGASDEDIEKLARCYWFSVEFGLCSENGKPKAYGAGLLSSFGELEYACSDEHPGAEKPPEIKPWDPEVAAHQEFPITTYQPVYFLAESLQDAKQRMRSYCENLQRPFFAFHNPQNDTVHIDRPVKRTKGVPEGERPE